MSLRNEFQAPQPNSNSANYEVVFINFESEYPWTHSAVQAGNRYLSIHPIEHFTPPTEKPFRDQDDTATKILEFSENVLKPMVFTDISYGNKNELLEYKHVKTAVNVSEEEFGKTQELIDAHITNQTKHKTPYSIFKFVGVSCAESSQQILETISENTTEANLAKRPIYENIVALPNSTFKRAQQVADSRKKSSTAIPTQEKSSAKPVDQTSKLGLFSKNPPNQSSQKAVEDFLSLERLTYF